jgi:hypothetical protein
MGDAPIGPWVEVVSLHPDVLSEHFSEDIFALDLSPLANGNPHVPVVYREPEHFFRSSYITNGLRSLLQHVLLVGDNGVASEISFCICVARHLLDAGRSAPTRLTSVDRDVGAAGTAGSPVSRKTPPRGAGRRRICLSWCPGNRVRST